MLCYCAEYAFKDAVGVCGVWGRYAFSCYGVESRSWLRGKVMWRHVQCFSVVAAEFEWRWNDHDGMQFGQCALGLQRSGGKCTDVNPSWGNAPAA